MSFLSEAALAEQVVEQSGPDESLPGERSRTQLGLKLLRGVQTADRWYVAARRRESREAQAASSTCALAMPVRPTSHKAE
jgi:hypothetical protein